MLRALQTQSPNTLFQLLDGLTSTFSQSLPILSRQHLCSGVSSSPPAPNRCEAIFCPQSPLLTLSCTAGVWWQSLLNISVVEEIFCSAFIPALHKLSDLLETASFVRLFFPIRYFTLSRLRIEPESFDAGSKLLILPNSEGPNVPSSSLYTDLYMIFASVPEYQQDAH